jgi:hypothetical protein
MEQATPRVGRWIAPLLLVGLLSACSSDGPTAPAGGNVALTTVEQSYRAGDFIEVTLQNNSTEALQSGACLGRLQLRAGTVWSPVPSPPVACPGILLGHLPGSRWRFGFALPRALPPGRYRLQLESLRGADGRALPASITRSNEFMVGPPGPELHSS